MVFFTICMLQLILRVIQAIPHKQIHIKEIITKRMVVMLIKTMVVLIMGEVVTKLTELMPTKTIAILLTIAQVAVSLKQKGVKSTILRMVKKSLDGKKLMVRLTTLKLME